MLKAILVDDEPIILEDLTDLLSANARVAVVGAYQNPLEALREIENTTPNCAFLDIEMGEMKGIELAERLLAVNPHMEIIFITAYNNYAAQAYELSALDYLLKPIRPERLEKAIDKLIYKVGHKKPPLNQVCKIRCFGAFEVSIGETSIKWGRSKSREFLAYMLQNEGKWVSKYRICEDLRPEDAPEQALTNLQIAVYTLRKNLKEAGLDQIEIHYSNDRYIVRVKEVHWDVQVFQEAYSTYKRTGSLSHAQQAVEHYRGEYLEGEDWLWSDLQRSVYTHQYEAIQKAL